MQNLCSELFAEGWDGAFRSLLTCDFHRAYANRDPERLAVMRPANEGTGVTISLPSALLAREEIARP